jgi:hypothetical protein
MHPDQFILKKYRALYRSTYHGIVEIEADSADEAEDLIRCKDFVPGKQEWIDAEPISAVVEVTAAATPEVKNA